MTERSDEAPKPESPGPAAYLVVPDPLARSGLVSALDGRLVLSETEDDAEVAIVDCGPDGEQRALPANLSSVALVPAHTAPRDLLVLGARGVLRRDAEADVIAAAALAVARGLWVADQPLVEARDDLPTGEELTPREQEVLELMADGLSNRRIAKRLQISEHTVKFHVNAVLLKLDADTRTEAVVTAARLGWLLL